MRPLGAYSDSRFVLFFVASGDKYLALPNGGMWVWAGLRELGDSELGRRGAGTDAGPGVGRRRGAHPVSSRTPR